MSTPEFPIVRLRERGFNPRNLGYYIKVRDNTGRNHYRLVFVGDEAAMLDLWDTDANRFEAWLKQAPILDPY